jgi:hypothetical protein
MILLFIPTTRLLAQGAEIRVLSPMPGEKVIGDTIAIYVETPGLTMTPSTINADEVGQHPEVNRQGQGHLRFILESQLSGFEDTTDSQGSVTVEEVIWDKMEPYVFTNVPPGNHILTIQILQNDHGSLDPPLVERIQFTSVAAPASSPRSPSTLPDTGVPSPLSVAFILVASGLLLMIGVRMRRRAIEH